MKIIIFSLFILIYSKCIYSQSYMPVLLNERGDTIHYTYPPPDSTYKHDELIVKFRRSGIKLQKLCYDYDYYEEGKIEKGDRPLGIYLSDSTISALMVQRFPIDSLV